MTRRLETIVGDAIPLNRVPTDARRLLESSLASLKGQADAFDVALSIGVDADVPATVTLDRGKIAWALTALVGNALRYVRRGSQTMPGGSIAVRASYDEVSRQVLFQVHDDGPGIPPDRLRSLFSDPADPPGIGLALTMVRDVVAAHGGTLAIDSRTDGLTRGTTVRFTLPAAA